MGFGIIGAALSGGMTGGGAALQAVGKQEWEKQMNNERDAAQFERQKNLETLKSTLNQQTHASNSAVDTDAINTRAGNALTFAKTNADSINQMKVDANSAITKGASDDAWDNSEQDNETAADKLATLQPFKMEEIKATGDQHARAASITAAAHMMLATQMQLNAKKLSDAGDNLTDAYEAQENAKTPEEKSQTAIAVNQAERAYKILNGKTTGSDLGANSPTAKLNLANQLTKQIKDANANLLTMNKEQRLAETIRIKGLVDQQTDIMRELTGQGGGKTLGDTSAFITGGAPAVPPKNPSVQSAPTGTPTPTPVDTSLADKVANAPPAMQALQAQLLKESTTLKQLKQSQSGIVSREKVSSNTRARDAQEAVVDDLKTRLNAASEEYGSYPYGRF